MKEYQAVRATRSILEVCKTPELAAQVTLQPIDRFALDAAIIFADILLPLEAMGLHLEFAEGEGPIIDNPVRSRADVDRLLPIDGGELRYVCEAIDTRGEPWPIVSRSLGLQARRLPWPVMRSKAAVRGTISKRSRSCIVSRRPGIA